ncbi:MAG: YfbK domain-containing protein, partial [Chthoniobacterales bacterium]
PEANTFAMAAAPAPPAPASPTAISSNSPDVVTHGSSGDFAAAGVQQPVDSTIDEISDEKIAELQKQATIPAAAAPVADQSALSGGNRSSVTIQSQLIDMPDDGGETLRALRAKTVETAQALPTGADGAPAQQEERKKGVDLWSAPKVTTKSGNAAVVTIQNGVSGTGSGAGGGRKAGFDGMVGGVLVANANPVTVNGTASLATTVEKGWELPVTKFNVGNSQNLTRTDDSHGNATTNRKLEEIRIPSINFREATVREALDFIKMRAAALDTGESDPNKRGINIVLKPDPANKAGTDARVTMELKDVPLGQALRYIADAAGLKAKVEPYAVAIVPMNETTDVLITKEYKVAPGFIPSLPASGGTAAGKPDAKAFLESSGMTFPPGATANYLTTSGKLIVRNTQDNIDLIDQLVESDAAAQDLPREPETKMELAPIVELAAADQPFSTFSLHVADVSFQLAKDAIERNEVPDPTRIRAEEFYNAFDYGDPAPAAGEEVSCSIEQAAHPFVQQRNLVRIAMKVGATGRVANQPLRLTILLDASGSMQREDRAASVRRALASLASLLGPQDRVTLIGFAREPRLLAEEVPGNEAKKLVEIANRTPSEGGTNIEAALDLAGELARKQADPAAQNRIVLLTDGAANLGNADPAQLAKKIAALREQNVAFDACGVGADGLDDEILEALTRKGDGRYYFLNKPADADAGFAKQLAGALRPAAENVKVQVKFNPARVGKYRLIGFDQYRLEKEDFRNDRVDAAELSAEEAAVALYQVEPLPEGEGEIGEVFVRFRDPATGGMIERSWTIPYDAHAPAFDKAAPSMQLAGVAALLAEKLQGREVGDLEKLAPVVNALRSHYPDQQRVADLVRMFENVAR